MWPPGNEKPTDVALYANPIDNTAPQYEALARFDTAGGPEKTVIVHHVAPPAGNWCRSSRQRKCMTLVISSWLQSRYGMQCSPQHRNRRDSDQIQILPHHASSGVYRLLVNRKVCKGH